MGPEPIARVVRSGLEESVHLGHIAVCDADGRLLARLGDPERSVFIRSCTKPIQAAVSLDAIGELPLSDRQAAIMCASHNGEPVHVRTVRSILRLGGLSAADLKTPPDRPIDPGSHRARPSEILHNCSGKHAGMLLACVRAGWPTADYRRRGHPLQRRVLIAVKRATGEPDVRVGVDGCGVPVHGVPLRAVATMYARLAAPEQLGRLAATAHRAVAAMRAEPYFVGGRGRDDTAIMRASSNVVAKEGAEALDCAVSLSAGIGVAVKVADGGYRAAGPALIHALTQLGLLSAAEAGRLRAERESAVLGGGRPAGKLTASFSLRGRN